MEVVWLKRDVRICDHHPLALAASGGCNFLILFIYEPDQLSHDSVHGSHVVFVNEGLADFNRRLHVLAGGREPVTTRRGEATAVLEELRKTHRICRLLSHQETGHAVSYERDKRVARWCQTHGVEWLQVPQSGVVRGLLPADESWYPLWLAQLESFLQADPVEDPFAAAGGAKLVLQRLVHLDSVGLVGPEELGLPASRSCDRPSRQRGGELLAFELLESFLGKRSERYSGGISSPNSAWTACSRLSPYIAWGHISVRTIWQAIEGRRLSAKGKWARSLHAFIVRLQWRCVYCQRFEMRYWMEHRNLCDAWEHLRQGHTFMFGDVALLGKTTEEERLRAFETGQTGFPMVDACMRCLLACGWLNFRMRCMLVSFAVYNLWLDWRSTAGHLARCFLDYEPGIHYPQLQMQAGTTGIDLRCYSVTRQAKDQDPEGEFIKRYVSELSTLPGNMAREPWKMQSLPAGYPPRIVDEAKTSKASKTAIAALQKQFTSGGCPRHLAAPMLPAKSDIAASGEVDEEEEAETQPVPAKSGSLLSWVPSKRQRQGPESAAAIAPRGPWDCPRCTLHNGESNLVCEVCEGPRPADITPLTNSASVGAATTCVEGLVIDLD